MAGTLSVVRFGNVPNASHLINISAPICHPALTTESVVLFTFGAIGMAANLFLMCLIATRKSLRRWSQGLLFHQGLVDFLRAALLIPLGISVFLCQRMPRCSVVETIFLLLVTVSTINMLTSVINDAPLVPEQIELNNGDTDALYGNSENHRGVHDSPQCIIFGIFIIWFASLTINLGPTFLSGALSSAREGVTSIDACPMVYAPVRHYVLNVLWVSVNVMCIILTIIHLRKLYKDLTKSNLEAMRIAGLVSNMLTVRCEAGLSEAEHIQNHIDRLEKEGISRVKMFVVLVAAYLIFWGPLFVIIVIQPGISGPTFAYELALHLAFAHTFVNPILITVLHKQMKKESGHVCCCYCLSCLEERASSSFGPSPATGRMNTSYLEEIEANTLNNRPAIRRHAEYRTKECSPIRSLSLIQAQRAIDMSVL
ncbi:uncharacterized protein LOC129960594 isoform X1 [Argiope bruennichi]|uniref:G-protein coupled receptors family 1 profile domain-containing protein n=1 Tax=Argiope bruennichi TaxID=94029 RepID=A0A8T0FJF9_ARGBR|nr:uncharacterized protein LOC129960594 isoform X1 [Argiope bruennichi]KAF8790592.1 hypothetical protein HNY73_005589 [Argiope bruennichi]